MSTVTPNLGLTLPTGTENVSRQMLNTNFSLIDTAFGDLQEVKLLTAGTDYTYTVLDSSTTLDYIDLYQVGKNHFYIVMQLKDSNAWGYGNGIGIRLDSVNGYNKCLTKTYALPWGNLLGGVLINAAMKIAVYNYSTTQVPANTAAIIATDFYMRYEE